MDCVSEFTTRWRITAQSISRPDDPDSTLYPYIISLHTLSRCKMAALTAPAPIPLGSSVPALTAHAISVSLPTWEDNIGYEEGDKRIVDKMETGYPRFFIHRSIQKVTCFPTVHSSHHPFAPHQTRPGYQSTMLMIARRAMLAKVR